MATQRVALVTGTSSGIGLHVAVGLARAGLHVVASMRDLSRAGALRETAAAAGVEVEVRALDVVDAAEARRCVEAVLVDHGRLDVLVNNAGSGWVASLEQLTDDDLRGQLELNFVAVARLTRLVLPAMREAGRGRVVTVTSVGGVVGQPFADAYCASKFAVEGLMQSLAPVAARFGIDVCVVEPAAVATNFVANATLPDGPRAGPHDERQTPGDDAYAPLLAAYLRRSAASFASAQAAADAAAVVVEAATTDAPRARWQTSAGAAVFTGLSLRDLDGSGVLEQTSAWLD